MAIVHYLTNFVEHQAEKHTSKVVNNADPTQVDTWTAYFELNHGWETPEKEKHEGEKCEECGQVVENNRCWCTDYCYPQPNKYELEVCIPCWVTQVTITAKTGEKYEFIWDNQNPGAWCGKTDAKQAEDMIDTILSCAKFTTKESFDSEYPSDYDPFLDAYGSNE